MVEEEVMVEADVEMERPCGLVVDFDYVMLNGLASLDAACVNVLTEAGSDLSNYLFVRSLFGRKPTAAINDYLDEDSDLSDEDVLEAIAGVIEGEISGASLNAAVVDLCKQAEAKNVQVAFVTTRAVALVEEKLIAAGFEEPSIAKLDRVDCMGEYNPEMWAKAARVLRLSPRYCTAVVATASSVRNAMMAGMRTVAFTNALVDFQDFSGADIVADISDAASLINATLEVVSPE